MKPRKVRLVVAKDRNGFECSACGEKFEVVPFKSEQLLNEAFERHLKDRHAEPKEEAA